MTQTMILLLNSPASVLPPRRGAEAVRQRHVQLRRRLQPRQPLRLPARRRRLPARLQGRVRSHLKSCLLKFCQSMELLHSLEHLPEDLIALPSMAGRVRRCAGATGGRTGPSASCCATPAAASSTSSSPPTRPAEVCAAVVSLLEGHSQVTSARFLAFLFDRVPVVNSKYATFLDSLVYAMSKCTVCQI